MGERESKRGRRKEANAERQGFLELSAGQSNPFSPVQGVLAAIV